MENENHLLLSIFCASGWALTVIFLIILVAVQNYVVSIITGLIMIITIIMQIVLSILRKKEAKLLATMYNELKTKYDELYNRVIQGDVEIKNNPPKQVKINRGDIFCGDNYTDMINKVLGTNYEDYNKSTVMLSDDNKKISAWFVFMDNSKHGNNDNYLWQNRISEDGNTIVEKCVSEDKTYARSIAPCQQETFAFQLDPNGEGNKNRCKFVGKFKMVDNDDENMIRIYTKIADAFILNIINRR